MPLSVDGILFLAEGGGFEPPVRLPVRQFSKLLVSATHPSFPALSANETATVWNCLLSKSDCKGTAFFWYDQIFWHLFCKKRKYRWDEEGKKGDSQEVVKIIPQRSEPAHGGRNWKSWIWIQTLGIAFVHPPREGSKHQCLRISP